MMTRKPNSDLRRGWTTGACATAATKAALDALWGVGFNKDVSITLPRGETPIFPIAHSDIGSGWAEVGITKDAGDDPDVTHGALIIVRVCENKSGIIFKAGEGVGTVTKAGLPIGVGEPAINPVPREMMINVVNEQHYHHSWKLNEFTWNNNNNNNNSRSKKIAILLSLSDNNDNSNNSLMISSREARHRMADTLIEEGNNCIQSKDWQLTSFPACNSIHEYDISATTSPSHTTDDTAAQLINHGYWRDVWKVHDAVLKTIRYEHDYTERNYDRHRRDALAMERLTASENVVDIYGFCGNSGVFQYSQEGDVYSMVWGRRSKNYSSIEALRTAEQIAAGIAAAHTFDGEDHATLAHTDITPTQFVSIDGKFRLNDFNRCRCKLEYNIFQI